MFFTIFCNFLEVFIKMNALSLYFSINSLYTSISRKIKIIHYCRQVSETLHSTRKVFGFLFMFMFRDSGRRNYPFYLKLGLHVYVWGEIISIFFVVHCRNCTCTLIQIYLNTLTTYGGKCVFFLSVSGSTVVAEIIRYSWNLAQICCMRN